MCRNIQTLFNFEPPATEDEVRAASQQYVRKISGFTKPSQANEPAFERAVDEVTEASMRLLDALVTNAAPEGPRGRGGASPGTGREALRRCLSGPCATSTAASTARSSVPATLATTPPGSSGTGSRPTPGADRPADPRR